MATLRIPSMWRSKLTRIQLIRWILSAGDAIITVTYENHPVKGKLVIHKIRGNLKNPLKKDFVYEETSLEGAEFEIYAAEDIFTPDHQVDEQGNRHVIYAKDTLVKTVTTNKNGEAVIKDLPLGKYRVKETKSTGRICLKIQTVRKYPLSIRIRTHRRSKKNWNFPMNARK